jgi:hypothetical protein
MFYKLRRAFVELSGVARARIAPATSLRELMPWKTRKKQWRKIQNHVNHIPAAINMVLLVAGALVVVNGSGDVSSL